MSDLRDAYDDGAVSNWISQPPLADLQDRARRRARRHRATGAVAVAVLAGLVAVPLLTLPGDSEPTTPTRPGPAGPSFPAVNGYHISLEFYDLEHGYAAYRLDNACGGYLSVTRDGGSSWSRLRELPGSSPADSELDNGRGEGVTACYLHRVIPVSSQTLVFPGIPEGTLPHLDWVDLTRAFISRDAGLTWQEYRPELRTADTVPPGVTPEAHCLGRDCAEVSLGWYDPQSGDPTVLRKTPPAAATDGDSAATAVAADGSIWVAGTDPGHAHLVSVSRDGGRSWQTSSLPTDRAGDAADPPDGRGTIVATADGTIAYTVAWQSAGEGRQGSLYRTTDAGQSWQPVTNAHRFRNLESMWVSPDGTLAMVDGDNSATRISTDGGNTFRTAGRALFQVEPIAGGFSGWAPDGIAGVTDVVDGALSTDGLTWRPVRVPRP